MTYTFTDDCQVEDFQGLEEYLEDNMEFIMEDWDDDQALEEYSLECAFGPEE